MNIDEYQILRLQRYIILSGNKNRCYISYKAIDNNGAIYVNTHMYNISPWMSTYVKNMSPTNRQGKFNVTKL